MGVFPIPVGILMAFALMERRTSLPLREDGEKQKEGGTIYG